ncbi:hypothetical protein PDESU_04056 [Pontiella desulfatans]|uniref:Uncharacterized protein n=1 Tax=Pontiella desulfatans TaxID=2750659 RepID=A0A6C2U6E3_PONDE|nr:beta-galactosidase [Pontiella desulfatans]VGO15473.1 hypothetical protein PDESU_04056 [Pontiella desulfatans]
MYFKTAQRLSWVAFIGFSGFSPAAKSITTETLLKPVETLSLVTCSPPRGIEFSKEENSTFRISGNLPQKSGTVVLRPGNGTWNASGFSYFRVDIENSGSGLVWIKGRLDNKGAQDWHNSTPSEAFIMPGERATLGFPFPRAADVDDAPEIFDGMYGKPNGYRSHWKPFDPAKISACRLQIHSSTQTLSLDNITVSLAQPYGAKANAALMELPYLDAFGQVRQLDWPGKLHRLEDLAKRNEVERQRLELDSGPAAFNPYGGWINGPQRKATGFFRTEKVDGKWWLVDPDGKLFFSHGVNSVGFGQSTPASDRKAMFESIPAIDGKGRIRFIEANLERTFGSDWTRPAADRLHKRMRSWGLNTLGAWADADLSRSKRTPYTAMLHYGGTWNPLGEGISDPYAPGFQHKLEKKLRSLVDPDDSFCIGVFIDNEIAWTHKFVREAFKIDWLPARTACIERLQTNYSTIGKLNAAWGTDYTDWNNIKEVPAPGQSEPAEADILNLRGMIAEAYYKTCRSAMRAALPNHLYLGSRMHNVPAEIVAQAIKQVDVLSLNSYEPLSGAKVPQGIDKPCIDSEFHFGAPDRGVPGVGLWPVADQLQRSRAYAAYVVAGVLHPNVVGTHWFAYSDQSAAGRPGENFQIGFVDVTDTPYPEITAASRILAEHLYTFGTEDHDVLTVLEKLWR